MSNSNSNSNSKSKSHSKSRNIRLRPTGNWLPRNPRRGPPRRGGGEVQLASRGQEDGYEETHWKVAAGGKATKSFFDKNRGHTHLCVSGTDVAAIR
jgi:hypothetical protein